MWLISNPDSFVALVCILVLLSIVLGLVMRRLHQPYIVSYILIGILVGNSGLEIVEDSESIRHLGEVGIILLLFFIGMEIDLKEFVKQWRVALLGTISQISVSVLLTFIVGTWFGWSMVRSIVVGFVISLSSSAVIIKILEEKGLLKSKVGGNVLSILLTQDILIVPLLIITSFLGGREVPFSEMLLMTVGGLGIMGFLVYLYSRKTIQLPFSSQIEKDTEMQVFLAILFCFGGAMITSLFGLSAALGAFIGGMVMHAAKETHWIHETLHSFRIIFVAIFFLSVGLQLDIDFIRTYWMEVSAFVCLVYFTNHVLNAVILRMFIPSWRQSLYGGALLAQIGELSFLISFSAFHSGIIGEFGYQFSLSIISLTLLFSPFYIALWERVVKANVV